MQMMIHIEALQVENKKKNKTVIYLQKSHRGRKISSKSKLAGAKTILTVDSIVFTVVVVHGIPIKDLVSKLKKTPELQSTQLKHENRI